MCIFQLPAISFRLATQHPLGVSEYTYRAFIGHNPNEYN